MRMWSALFLAALGAGACERLTGGERRDTIPRERFVAVNVALRTIEVPAGDSARTRADSVRARADSARLRAAVLKKQGVTPKQMQAYVDAHGNDPDALAETWKEIADRLARADSVARADSTRRAAKADSAEADSTKANGSKGPPAAAVPPARRTVRPGPPGASPPRP